MEGAAEHVGPGLREVFALINLAIVIAIIVIGARKGIRAAIDARTADVSRKIVDAKAELERMKLETEKARRDIVEIEKTKEKFITEMRDEGQKLFETIVRDAKSSADRILSDARSASESEISNAATRIRQELVSRALGETLQMASNSPELKQKLHDRLVERFLTQNPNKEGAGA